MIFYCYVLIVFLNHSNKFFDYYFAIKKACLSTFNHGHYIHGGAENAMQDCYLDDMFFCMGIS